MATTRRKGRPTGARGKRGMWGREALILLLCLGAALLAAFLFRQFVAQQVKVSGSSMEPTLQEGDRLILEKVSYRLGDPGRFDVIVFQPYEDRKDVLFIKRVIGLPGETLRIRDGEVYVDGSRMEEGSGAETIRDAGLAADELSIGEKEYFVLGDNRDESMDSRFEEVGLVRRERILGRALLRIWPPGKTGIVGRPGRARTSG